MTKRVPTAFGTGHPDDRQSSANLSGYPIGTTMNQLCASLCFRPLRPAREIAPSPRYSGERVGRIGIRRRSATLRPFLAALLVVSTACFGVTGQETGSRVQVRTWTDLSGRFTVQAKFDGLDDGKVRLRKADGTVVTVPAERLSEVDQEWLRRESGSQPRPARSDSIISGPSLQTELLPERLGSARRSAARSRSRLSGRMEKSAGAKADRG